MDPPKQVESSCRHFQRTNLADPEASLALVPAFIMEPPAVSLLTPLQREPDPGPGYAGVHLADGFTLLEAPPKKAFGALQIFLKRSTTFNLSHRTIYNRISEDVLCLCRFNFVPNPYMPSWPVSRSITKQTNKQTHVTLPRDLR